MSTTFTLNDKLKSSLETVHTKFSTWRSSGDNSDLYNAPETSMSEADLSALVSYARNGDSQGISTYLAGLTSDRFADIKKHILAAHRNSELSPAEDAAFRTVLNSGLCERQR